MRDIIREVIASPIPVAIYVVPSGAGCRERRTYILFAGVAAHREEVGEPSYTHSQMTSTPLARGEAAIAWAAEQHDDTR